VQCGEAGSGGARGTIIVGGQGTYVRLASSGTAYDSTLRILSSQVTVRNLLAQAMGTTTGADTAGVRVFFDKLPTVTAGTGAVEVANEDGTEAFTASAQPYFHYGEIIAPQGTSLPKRWEFSVPPTVETFAFTVLVQTSLHDEGAPLRWTRMEPGAQYAGFVQGVWSTGRETFAVGDVGVILRHDGTRWARMPSPGAEFLYGVWGASPRAVFAVGSDGAALRFDGNRWAYSETGTRSGLEAVWGTSESNVLAVGRRGTIVRWNGAAWSPMASGTRADLFGVWGASASNVFAVGTRVDTLAGTTTTRQRGVMLRYDGSAWTETVISTTEEYRLFGLAGRDTAHLYAVGAWRAQPTDAWKGVVLAWDGAAWTRVALAGTRMASAWMGADGEVLAAGDGGVVVQFDGTAWTSLPSQGFAVASAFRVPDGALWAGGGGVLYRREGGAWVPDAPVPAGGLIELYRIWVAGPNRAFAVGGYAALPTDWDGTAWRTSPMDDSNARFTNLWGRSETEVYAVGSGFMSLPVIGRWTGSHWTVSSAGAPTPGREEELTGVSGTPGGDTYVSGMLRHASDRNRADGIVRRRVNGEWPVIANLPEVQLFDIWAGSPSDVWTVGRAIDPVTRMHTGVAVRVDGPSPTPMVLDPYSTAFAVWGASADDVFAAGYRWSFARQRYVGVVWHYDGTAWTAVAETGGNQYLTDIHGSSGSDVYAVGYGGAMLHFDGISWQPVDTGSNGDLSGVHSLSRSDVFAVGWRGEFLRGQR
jgi:hypothetical protein